MRELINGKWVGVGPGKSRWVEREVREGKGGMVPWVSQWIDSQASVPVGG